MEALVIIFLVVNTLAIVWLINEQGKSSQLIKENKVAVDLKVSPLWAKVQQTLSDELKHEGNPEMDVLLEKLESLTISREETLSLKNLLSFRWAESDITKKERASAYIMATIMDKVLEEANTSGELVNVQLVGESPENEEKN